MLSPDSLRGLHFDVGQPHAVNSSSGLDAVHIPMPGINSPAENLCSCGYCILARTISFPSALEELYIRPFHQDWQPIEEGHLRPTSSIASLPFLRKYDGTVKFFKRLPPSPSLKAVTLRGLVGDYGILSWEEILGCSREKAALIQELNVHVRSISVGHGLLRRIGGTDIGVKALRVFLSGTLPPRLSYKYVKVSDHPETCVN